MLLDIVFGPWRPDLPSLNNPGLTVAKNVTPGIGTYGPLRRATTYSATTMASRPLGTFSSQDSLGNSKIYGGCSTKLYKVNPADKGWLDVSRAANYTTASTEAWRFAEFGSAVMGTNFTNEPQIIDMNVDVQFGNLTTLCKGRYIGVFKNFAILANTYDALDGAKPNRIRWSADGNPFDWNFSVATQSDFQDINDFGAITGLVCDDYVWVLMQRGVVRMTYIGAPYVFQLDTAMNGKGCTVPQSVVTVAGKTFFLSDDGFYQMEKGNFANIGDGKVNKHFLADADSTQYHWMSVASDPENTLVYWSYVSNSAIDGTPDKMIIYNYLTGEWSEADATADYIWNSKTLPWTIDQLDVFGSIDEVPASFDSTVWSGGKPTLWGMRSTGAILTFGGATLTAVLETQEQHLIRSLQAIDPKTQGDNTNVLGVRPLFEGANGSATVIVGSRSLSNGTVEWSNVRTTSARTGWAYFKRQSRFHRFRVMMQGDWAKAYSIQIDANSAGFR